MAGKFKIVISALDTTDAVLGKIRHNLGAVGRSVDKLKKRFPNMAAIAGGALRKVSSALKTVAKSAGIAAAAGAGIFAFMIKSSLSATDNLAKTARKIGTTTEALSKMRYAADLTGVSSTTMDMALQRFTRRTAEAAKGTGEAKDALKELNINARQMLKLPLEEQMLELSKAFEDVKNPADRVRLAMKLFDSEGVALVNTLGLGEEALKDMMGEAAALGIVMSQDAAEGVEDANDAFSRLGYLFKGVRDQLTGALAPALESFATFLKEKLQTAIQESGGTVEKFAQDLAIKIMDGVAGALQALQSLINGVIRTFNEIKLAASDFTGFFKSDDEKNAAQLQRRLEKINEAMAERQKIIDSTSARQRKSAELAQESDAKQKKRIEELLAKRKEIGDVPLVPEVNFMDAINETFEKIKSGIKGVQEQRKLDEDQDTDSDAAEEEKKGIQAITDFKLHHQDLLKQGEEKFTIFQKKNAVDKTKAVLDGLSETMKGSGRISKKMFAMEKAVAIGKTIMATYESATKAFAAAGGFPMGIPAAAMSIASGMANVAAIRAQSFDGGGFTGFGARTGGIDGKGGFPAILHSNETIVDHTKPNQNMNMRSGDSIVVNQSINVTTGVQDTVRAEIMNLMPQIAETAQNAVLSARMRGGSYSKQLMGR